jgi:hypothetical protein
MSNADKRNVHTDALDTLGSIITENEKRDAIHLAVEPAVAGHQLMPGDHVGFLKDGRIGHCEDPVGIVDPFLKTTVKKGERFWLVVYPRQITSLRHVWTHPAFGDEPMEPADAGKSPAEISEAWLREFCRNADCPGYDDVMTAVTGGALEDYGYGDSYRNDGEYLFFAGRDAHGEIPPEFWDHVEVVTGKKIGPEDRAQYFSCSC